MPRKHICESCKVNYLPLSKCRDCKLLKAKDWYEKNKDKYSVWRKSWRHENKEYWYSQKKEYQREYQRRPEVKEKRFKYEKTEHSKRLKRASTSRRRYGEFWEAHRALIEVQKALKKKGEEDDKGKNQ